MFKELYEAWRKEAANTDLQPLPSDFYAKLVDYENHIRKETRMLDRKTVKAQLISREARNTRKLARKLAKLRYRKILQMASTGKSIPLNVLSAEEEKFYSELSRTLESFQNFLKDVSKGRLTTIDRKNLKKAVARFLQETPAIIGTDLKPYGPFKPEDVASLPIENANALAKQGIVKILDVK